MYVTFIVIFIISLGNAYYAHCGHNHFSNGFDSTLVEDKCENGLKHNYFDNLLKNLHQEPWEPDQMTCKHKILSVIDNVQNFTLWAVWIWDSMSINPVGNMMGSSYHLGNFDQCLMKTPWALMNTKYCLTRINVQNDKYINREEINKNIDIRTFDPHEKADKYIHTHTGIQIHINEIYWGVCLPKECNERSVERFTRSLLKSSYLGFMDSTTSIDASVINCHTQKNTNFNNAFIFLLSTIILFLITLVSDKFSKSTNTMGICHIIAKSFSLSENYNNLMKPQEGGLECVNGIRFIASSIIVLLHSPLFIYPLFSNGLEFDQIMLKGIGSLRTDLAVDAFYCLSGLLLMKSLISKPPKNITDLVVQVLRRYVRLMPLVVVAILSQYAVAEMGQGPFFTKVTDEEIRHCNNNWWTNLLMIINMYDAQNMCLPVSWYVSSDFQMFLCTLVLFYLYKKGYIGNITLSIVGFATILTPGFVRYWHGFRPIPLFAMRNIKDLRQDSYFADFYIPTYTRGGSYLVGLMAGYFISLYKLPDYKGLLNKHQSSLGVVVAFGIIVLIHILGGKYYEQHGVIEEFFYTCLERPLLAVAVALIIICCSYGDVPIIKSIVCHHFFVPLCKLTYGVYLFHINIVARFFMVSRSPVFGDTFVLIMATLGVLVLSYTLSLVLHLLVEVPMYNLCDQIVVPLLRKKTYSEANNNQFIFKNKTHHESNNNQFIHKKIINGQAK